MSEMRKKAIEGINVNDTFTVERTFTEQDVIQFADVTRDYNPFHLVDRFTAAKKLPGRICHGLLVASMMTQIGGQMGWLASHFDLHFMPIRLAQVRLFLRNFYGFIRVHKNPRRSTNPLERQFSIHCQNPPLARIAG